MTDLQKKKRTILYAKGCMQRVHPGFRSPSHIQNVLKTQSLQMFAKVSFEGLICD